MVPQRSVASTSGKVSGDLRIFTVSFCVSVHSIRILINEFDRKLSSLYLSKLGSVVLEIGFLVVLQSDLHSISINGRRWLPNSDQMFENVDKPRAQSFLLQRHKRSIHMRLKEHR